MPTSPISSTTVCFEEYFSPKINKKFQKIFSTSNSMGERGMGMGSGEVSTVRNVIVWTVHLIESR